MTNSILHRFVGVLTVLLLFSVLGCKDKSVAADKTAPMSSATTDPRAKVIGVAPGGAAADTAATTSSAKSDISKSQEASAMPLPGQANDHSTLSPKPTQKAAPTVR